MNCATSIASLSSSQLNAAAANGLLTPQAEYYVSDLARVAIADSDSAYHLLSDDGTGVETIAGDPGCYVPGQGRQFSGAGSTFTPTAGRLYGVLFAHRGTFAGLGLYVATAGSSDSVARAGIYYRDRNGRPAGLKETLGEFNMNVGGQRDFLYPLDRFIDTPYCAGIVFGGSTMPVVAAHTASSEEGARMYGNGDCQGPNPPFSGVYVDLLGGYPASLPDPFPMPYTVAAFNLGLGAKIA